MKAVSRSEIDDVKWNVTIRNSSQPRHYLLTYYLDACADEWSALIWGDYEVLWPLPFKKFPVKRVFQPLLIQQLGPSITPAFSNSILNEGLGFIKKNYSSFSLKFNDSILGVDDTKTEEHHNIELDLDADYLSLEKAYNRNVRSNLKKAEKAGLFVEQADDDFEFVIEAFKNSKRSDSKILDKRFYKDVKVIYTSFLKRGEASCFIAKINGDPVAGMMILNMENRILNFFTGTTHKARGVGAMHAVIDHVIQKNCNRAATFDFEGSDDNNLRFFYQSFGGVDKVYLQVYSNQIIWPLNKILK